MDERFVEKTKYNITQEDVHKIYEQIGVERHELESLEESLANLSAELRVYLNTRSQTAKIRYVRDLFKLLFGEKTAWLSLISQCVVNKVNERKLDPINAYIKHLEKHLEKHDEKND